MTGLGLAAVHVPGGLLDHPAHPFLLEFVGQLVQMGLAPLDELLLRGVDGVGRDRVPSGSRRASRAEVLPVCRGAYNTK